MAEYSDHLNNGDQLKYLCERCPHIFEKIMFNLSTNTIVKCIKVSKYFKKFLTEDSKLIQTEIELWKKYMENKHNFQKYGFELWCGIATVEKLQRARNELFPRIQRYEAIIKIDTNARFYPENIKESKRIGKLIKRYEALKKEHNENDLKEENNRILLKRNYQEMDENCLAYNNHVVKYKEYFTQ